MVLEALEQLGGVASRRQLVRSCGRSAVDRAVAAGDVTVLARGRYALPSADRSRSAAHRVTGVVSHTSAALLHGWEVALPPRTPDVTVAKDRRLTAEQRRGIELHWADLGADDVRDGVTSQERTLLDCLRTLPPEEGLAVADSALRAGFPRERLAALARGARGPGSARVRAVAPRASPRAANPFESVLRGIAADVAGLEVRPQVSIYDPAFLGRPDLLDQRLQIVLEADSFEWHGGRAQLDRDARRYNRLVVHGWWVLRFSWEQVMFERADVAATLEAAVDQRTDGLCPQCRAA